VPHNDDESGPMTAGTDLQSALLASRSAVQAVRQLIHFGREPGTLADLGDVRSIAADLVEIADLLPQAIEQTHRGLLQLHADGWIAMDQKPTNETLEATLQRIDNAVADATEALSTVELGLRDVHILTTRMVRSDQAATG